MCQVCGQFAAWSSAWLQGRAAFDDVIAHSRSGAAGVSDLSHDGGFSAVGEVLAAWRRAGASGVRAAFPVPGDVRGVPGPAAFRTAALDAGAAVLGGTVGLVPQPLSGAASSAHDLIRWQIHDVADARGDFVSLEDAAHELAESIRESASVLAGASPAGWTVDVREDLSDARRAGERLVLPPGYPQRAVSLLAQAERLALVLDLASSSTVDLAGRQAERDEALRPLATAVRRARVAGYNVLAPTG